LGLQNLIIRILPMKKILFLTMIVLTAIVGKTQTADEIIQNANDVIGGSAWDKVNSIKMSSIIEEGGMKIPLEIVVMRDGRTYTKFNLQGMDIFQNVFDGTNLWSINFLTQKPEKADNEEVENFKRNLGDFPSPMFTYKKSGYAVERLADDVVDGVNCYKIQMTKKPQMADGVEVSNIDYHYIDKDSYALIMTETEIMSGEMKGKISQIKYSDYQEVSGVFMPYSMDQGIKDLGAQTIAFTTVEINASIDETVFAYKGE
jgi:hypothetical protein